MSPWGTSTAPTQMLSAVRQCCLCQPPPGATLRFQHTSTRSLVDIFQDKSRDFEVKSSLMVPASFLMCFLGFFPPQVANHNSIPHLIWENSILSGKKSLQISNVNLYFYFFSKMSYIYWKKKKKEKKKRHFKRKNQTPLMSSISQHAQIHLAHSSKLLVILWQCVLHEGIL